MGAVTKQTIWIKKRTSRGGGRAVKSRPTPSTKNIKRDAIKNQVAYSHYLLKLCLLFALGLCWVRLGAAIGSVSVIPIGLIIGLLVVALERLSHLRLVELSVITLACLLSFLLPIGIII